MSLGIFGLAGSLIWRVRQLFLLGSSALLLGSLDLPLGLLGRNFPVRNYLLFRGKSHLGTALVAAVDSLADLTRRRICNSAKMLPYLVISLDLAL